MDRRPIKTYGGKYYSCKNDNGVEYRHVTCNNKAAWKVNKEDEDVRISWKSWMGGGGMREGIVR